MAVINISKENDINIATFDSEINRFNALITEEVKDSLSAVLDDPHTKLVLDLKGINYIDSSGFGVFLSLLKKANNNYGSFKICMVNDDVMELFELLQLHQVFELYKDLEECKASY